MVAMVAARPLRGRSQSAGNITEPVSDKRPSSKRAPSRKSKADAARREEPTAVAHAPQRGVELGDGTTASPLQHVIGVEPNAAACYYCPTDECCCEYFFHLLGETWDSLPTKRVTSVTGKRWMCAKSIEPNFVSRIVRLLRITSEDTFYDLGSGNGSVLFQIAFMTGAKCVGVELSKENAELSRAAWEHLRPRLETVARRKMPEVRIVHGDLTRFIADPSFGASPKTVIWTSNLLMPRGVTQFMAERFRLLPEGVRIACFDDLYPHSRPIARVLDPSSFLQFRMTDCVWPRGAVEWCYDEGRFFLHERTAVTVEEADARAAAGQ